MASPPVSLAYGKGFELGNTSTSRIFKFRHSASLTDTVTTNTSMLMAHDLLSTRMATLRSFTMLRLHCRVRSQPLGVLGTKRCGMLTHTLELPQRWRFTYRERPTQSNLRRSARLIVLRGARPDGVRLSSVRRNRQDGRLHCRSRLAFSAMKWP